MSSYPFTRPNDTSTGGAGGGARGGMSTGSGRVSCVAPPRPRPFPWPLPSSATQGSVGGAGGSGRVSVSAPPYYPPFRPYWPYATPAGYFLPTNPVRL